jgi:predicted ribosome quality control (RQC) complex YloA/Tae2 family protein
MRFLAGIKNEETRQTAETALLGGKSPDMVKVAARRETADGDEENPRGRLEKEKQRLERTIASLSKRLEEVERKLETAE